MGRRRQALPDDEAAAIAAGDATQKTAQAPRLPDDEAATVAAGDATQRTAHAWQPPDPEGPASLRGVAIGAGTHRRDHAGADVTGPEQRHANRTRHLTAPARA